jgi:ADP-heptose:LPS heptosyltransferase
VVSLDNLGDLVFTSVLTRDLRLLYPQAQITVWCKQYTALIAAMLPGVDYVEAAEPFWDAAPGCQKGSVRAFLASVRRLRAQQFDLAILAAAPWRTAAAVAATGSRVRIGARRRKNAMWLTNVVSAEDSRKPVLEEMRLLLAPLQRESVAAPRYALNPAPLRERQARMREMLARPIIALHPFASQRNRCVHLSVWVDAAHRLESRELEPLWIASPSEMSELQRAIAGTGWRTVADLGDGSLADTAAALACAVGFIGHDSGPLHIAGALGVPVVGIFTPGEPLRTFPQGMGPSTMLQRPDPLGVRPEDLVAAAERLVPALTRLRRPLRPEERGALAL